MYVDRHVRRERERERDGGRKIMGTEFIRPFQRRNVRFGRASEPGTERTDEQAGGHGRGRRLADLVKEGAGARQNSHRN